MSAVCRGFGVDGPVGSGPTVERENPANVDEVVVRTTTTTPAEVDDVVAGAADAQRHWAQRPLTERIAALEAAASAVAGVDTATLLARELGKPRDDSAGETAFAAAFARHVADRAPEVLADSDVDDDAGRVRLIRRPLGVVAAIVPWNAPLILASLKVAPAVAAGNAVVVKPSPLAPAAITQALAAMAEALPPGVLSVVHGGADVGRALVGNDSVAKVAFTGGEEVGRAVMRMSAERLIPTVMELGGNDPALVLDDAELDEALFERLVFGAFLTTGQVCMAAKRIYVPRAVLADVVDGLAAAADRVLVCGDPLGAGVTIGPMVSAEQRDRVDALVEGARRRGATVRQVGTLVDGWDPDRGYFLRPTVVSDLPHDDELVATEQFGPTVPVVGYDSLDDAVEMANDGPWGLGSSVWSADEDRAFRVAGRLDAGMTFINCHNRAGMSLRVPFGGVKRSGFGREFGDEGIAEYSQTHAVHIPASMRSGDAAATAVSGRHYPL